MGIVVRSMSGILPTIRPAYQSEHSLECADPMLDWAAPPGPFSGDSLCGANVPKIPGMPLSRTGPGFIRRIL